MFRNVTWVPPTRSTFRAFDLEARKLAGMELPFCSLEWEPKPHVSGTGSGDSGGIMAGSVVPACWDWQQLTYQDTSAGCFHEFLWKPARDGPLALPMTLRVRESSLGSHPSSLTYCVTSNMLSNCFMHQFPHLRVEDRGSWHATVHGVAKGQTRPGY